MNKGAKVLLGAGILGGSIALIAALIGRAQAENPNFTLRIYDADGNLVASSAPTRAVGSFPGALVEGGSGYTAVLSVNNTSKYPDGTPAPYLFTIAFVGGVNNPVGSYFPPGATHKTLSLAAGASGSVSFTFAIPYGMNGPGSAAGNLEDIPGNVLATASATINVTPAVITPGGTLSF